MKFLEKMKYKEFLLFIVNIKALIDFIICNNISIFLHFDALINSDMKSNSQNVSKND